MPDVLVQQNVPVEMRDGVRLNADVYRPSAPGQYPVLLCRTAYSKAQQTTGSMLNAVRAAQEGYVVVVQDCRGRYTSPGEWQPFFPEIEDGYDTVEWCAAQEWSNGRVGMYGMSYVGATQWLAAISSPPSLRCIFPVMTAADYYDGWVYQGGAFSLAFTSAWTAQFLAIPHLAKLGLSPEECKAEELKMLRAIERLRPSVSKWPLKELPLLRREGLAPYFYDWLDHPSLDDYWRTVSISTHHGRVTVPAYNFGGWYDLFLAGPLRNFEGMRKNGGSETARRGQKLLVGPWTHNAPTVALVGERFFGFEATLVLEDLQFRWFDHWLKDIDTGLLDEPAARLYVMNDGWRDEQEWPLAQTEYTPFYLHSGGRATSLSGDGALNRDEPGEEPPDIFLYNPLNPVPTVGAGGIWNHRAIDERHDVLVYSTPPLTEPLEVTGPVRLVLHASTSAVDTDFVARLIDVSPNGYSTNLCEGVLRARYRGGYEQPELLEPGRPYRFEIDMLMTSNLFRPGHQVRLELTSSSFPRYDRNPNTGEPAAQARTTCPAVQTVFHDSVHPSHLLLPVIPRDGSRSP
jgi:putative CocE/NonD family hydrolase